MTPYTYTYDTTDIIRLGTPIDLDALPQGATEHVLFAPTIPGTGWATVRFERRPEGTTIATTPGIAPVLRGGTYIGVTPAPAGASAPHATP